jgi:hypothetical protein
MKNLILLSLVFVSSCATKYIIPGNRFMTPESQGGAMRGQIELQQTGANQLRINTSNRDVDSGVKYEDVRRMGFLLSNSLFDQFDVVWSHTGGGNSLLGGKLQLMGASRSGNGTGHKAAISVLVGGNEHEDDEDSIEFELSGREYLLLYGYRISENILPYASFSYATFNFEGDIKKGFLRGRDPEMVTDSKSLNTGVEFALENFFIKTELTYQQLETSDTKDRKRFIFGYSVGYSW